MTHHLGGERRGDGTGTGDLFCARAVESLHDRVEKLSVGISIVEDGSDFIVDPGNDFSAQ